MRELSSKTACRSRPSKALGSRRPKVSWYWFSSPYCRPTMSETESRTPKPVTSRAVHPAMPTTVIKNRFLYRNRFRAVVF